MAKLLDPEAMLRSLCDEFHQRAKAAQLPRPSELGLHVDDEMFRLVLSRRSVRLAGGPLPKDSIRCDRPTFLKLLLGQIDLAAALKFKQIYVRGRLTRQIVSAIFPPPMPLAPAIRSTAGPLIRWIKSSWNLLSTCRYKVNRDGKTATAHDLRRSFPLVRAGQFA